jgi:hypothetical protein
MSAPYKLDVSMTDAETFALDPLAIVDSAGAPLVWADFTFDYSIMGDCTSLKLTEGAGITIDVANNTVLVAAVDPDFRLPAGEYKHGFRIKEDATGVTLQYFDGTVTVSEGNF